MRAALAQLERLLAEENPSFDDLGQIGDPDLLDLVFQVHLGTLLRAGPPRHPDATTPDRLLLAARAAAARGHVPLHLPATLRRALDEMAELLREAQAWDISHPLWWEPLPEKDDTEHTWDRVADEAFSLPEPSAFEEAFGDAGPSWLALPSLLAEPWTATIWRDLACGQELELERGGVGDADRRSARRSDRVRYISGHEHDLLGASLTLAALVQWGLTHLARALRSTGRRVHAPQKAMLARYPAPSPGYAPHLDNPGGPNDNGRVLTLVVYLNAPGQECAGGELALWGHGTKTSEPPTRVLEPRAGSAILFDSRTIAHQVRPLLEGNERWALTFWFQESPPPPKMTDVFPRPRHSLTDLLLPVTEPPVPAGKVLFHELDDERLSGRVVVRTVVPGTVVPGTVRAGIVCTVYGGAVYGDEGELDAWCEHHLALGFAHLVLVFDRLEETAEAAAAARLRNRYPDERLTIRDGREVAERWASLAGEARPDDLVGWARAGASPHAVAARQTLNASVVLEAARGSELGGEPLDWLVHLDADERFHLEGNGRGGASLDEHFATLGDAGVRLVRYVNHELLHRGDPPLFKLNPRLAAARLGTRGWDELLRHLAMGQDDERPYFRAYFNGKSAVAVGAARAAAGVHGFTLAEPGKARFLAGPSILHFHFASAAAFRHKYLDAADAPTAPAARAFEPSPVEERVMALIRVARRDGVSEDTLTRRLDALHARLTTFSDADVDLLDEAGLLLRPE